jgi:N-acetylmuramoyl-L-alanine amidase
MRMRKKIAFIVMALILTVSLFACGEDITISIPDQEITLKEGDTYQINAETNDESLSYQSSNEAVLTVSDTGLIEAISPGEVTVVITSDKDVEVQVIITVIVEKLVELEADQTSYTLKVGETIAIDITSNDTFVCDDKNDPTFDIDNDCNVIGKAEGEGTLTVTSVTDPSISIDITIIVRKVVTLEVEQESISIKVGESGKVIYESNDEVIFETSDSNILEVDDEGNILALLEGETTVTVTSVKDPTVSITVPVMVKKIINLNILQESYEVFVDKSIDILFESNDDVYYEVENESILVASTDGTITGLEPGLTTVTVISSYDGEVSATITVRVYAEAESINITGKDILNINDSITLSYDVTPIDSYATVSWTSSDDSIATIDDEGVLIANKTGFVVITATSNFDDTLISTFEVEIVDYMVVDGTKNSTDSIEYLGLTFNYDVNLFDNIQEAIDMAREGATIFVFEGVYDDAIVLDVNFLTIEGVGDSIINSSAVVDADNISIQNLHFTGQSSIVNTSNINGLTFKGNVVEDITSVSTFIEIEGVSDIEISENTFSNLNGNAIAVKNYTSGLIKIYKNNITVADTAIIISALNDYDIETKIQIERNIISSVNVGLDIFTISSINIDDYARFNQVSNYSVLAVKANANHNMDFTLNYWGSETPIYSDFENITEYELRGYYSNSTSIISESEYKVGAPVKILLPYYELEATIGEVYDIDYELLPTESSGSVKYITSNPEILRISDDKLNLVRSGESRLTILLNSNYNVYAVLNVSIITTPGIEVTPSVADQAFIVGDTLTLSSEVFPYTIADEAIYFESSDSTIATINQDGEIYSYSAGIVTFTTFLVNDPSVKTEFTIEFHSELSNSNLLDLLTMNQVNYTMPHTWTAYGNGYNYTDFKYESVSRYYFGDLEVNQSKMVPVSSGIRPGEPMDPHPTGITQYNPYNVYWVVIHDTANTSTGSGALAHANYLYNAAMNGTELWASWHFTIDDKYIYQHLPETERGYHAGDGSSLPLQGTTYLGGGNRNGIGIEMGVNDDADVYRIWQRTAKFAAELLTKYNLPRENMKYHNDFSGKDCPNTLRNAGLIPLFEKFVDIEYELANSYSNASITFVSNNPEYLDNAGRIIQMPDRAMTVSYTVTVSVDGVNTARTFYSYLPGTVK